jgi:hypothetical protein
VLTQLSQQTTAQRSVNDPALGSTADHNGGHTTSERCDARLLCHCRVDTSLPRVCEASGLSLGPAGSSFNALDPGGGMAPSWRTHTPTTKRVNSGGNVALFKCAGWWGVLHGAIDLN